MDMIDLLMRDQQERDIGDDVAHRTARRERDESNKNAKVVGKAAEL